MKLKADVMGSWLEGDLSKAYPEGESGEQVVNRGLQSLVAAASMGTTVIVVAHGGLIKMCALQIECSAEKGRTMTSPS
eukprot:CAMPEP_0197698658 /NCGR_PEP_ID=MMETSP1338-20131121/119596_1 /TAXON_ID=43686 ORGANISM="Pelagodinium beii, Strain RCC1491" /NCGR_SAMPLE_ID=MMETSP1338 /ASSEMBLY_ACC=CAM_ASM_000754 /LENGTH=77 /DNA_ID=CAMNT_0043282073 /DNA_START=15 /DNA_END=245 /DNA_ORIENTATION=-